MGLIDIILIMILKGTLPVDLENFILLRERFVIGTDEQYNDF